MRRKTFDRFAHLIRAAFLLAALGAGATAAIWHWWPGVLQRIELGLRKTLHGPYYVATERAAALAETDPQAARAVLRELVDSLAFVRKGDQLAGLYNGALQQLGGLAQAAGDLDEAVLRARQRLELDDQDVPARRRLGELLCAREATRAEGLQVLRELRQLLPADDGVTAVLVRKLVEAGRPEEALAVLRDLENVMRPGLWLVRWKSPEGDRGRVAGLVPKDIGDGMLELRFAIAGPLLEFSILPPGHAGLRLHDAQVFYSTEDSESAFPLDSGFVSLDQIRSAHGGLETIVPGSPRITVTLPQPLGPGTWEFGLRARVAPGISRHLEALPFARELAGPVAETLPQELASALASIRAQALATSRIQVYWHGRGEHFKGERSRFTDLDGRVGEDGCTFTLELPLEVDAERLRIDFPDFPGAEYRFARMEVRTDAGTEDLEPAAMEIAEIHSMRREGSAFVVIGDDPYFAFSVPGGHRRVGGLRLQGVAR